MVNQLERCEPWISAALQYSGGTHEVVDVFDGILEGRMQLWPAENSCLVTEILAYPRKKVLHIFLAGGDLDEITGMHQDVIAWAKGQGCSGLTLAGRPGWKKALEKFGWKPTLLTLGKDI